MIQITTYTIEELLTFIKSEAYANMPVIPISPQRVLSIAHSPRTKPHHVVLACAYEGKTLVGYLGLLPDICAAKETIYEIGWLSSMWVSTAHRGKGIAPQLINSLLTAWDNWILTTNQSPTAAIVFNKHPNFITIPNTGTRYYMNSRLAYFIVQKNPALHYLTPLLKVIDSAINTLVGLHRFIQPNGSITFQTTQEISPELALLIQTHSTKSHCIRGIEEFAWMMKYPWVYQADEPDYMAHKYEFTISTKDYCNEFVLCYQQNRLVGAALVMLKNGELKISYAWCTSSDESLLAIALQQYMQQHGVFEVTVFNSLHQNLVAHQGAFYLYKKTMNRAIYATQQLGDVLEKNTGFLDGDGDCCFA